MTSNEKKLMDEWLDESKGMPISGLRASIIQGNDDVINDSLVKTTSNEVKNLKQIWLTIKSLLKTNTKPLPIVDFNEENYKKYLNGGEKPMEGGYKNIPFIMATVEKGGFDLYKKLGTKEGIRKLKAGRTMLLAGIQETLKNPTLVISDHDEKSRSATSYIRSYSYTNDREQLCNSLLKVVVTSENIVISAYFVNYDNIRDLILKGRQILKQ